MAKMSPGQINAYVISELLDVTPDIVIDFHNEEPQDRVLADMIHGVIRTVGRKDLRGRIKTRNCPGETMRKIKGIINLYGE